MLGIPFLGEWIVFASVSAIFGGAALVCAGLVVTAAFRALTRRR